MQKKLSPPVVLFLYKRSLQTREILKRVVTSNPRTIYIFSDGPKFPSDTKDVENVRQVVNEVIQANPNINFNCTYSETNLGLRTSIESGLHKVFSKEKTAIILEDDCIPSPVFFRFMNEMLVKYQTDPRVMSVTGSGHRASNGYSYDFSIYEQCWGWATWQRAWHLYDPTLPKYETLKLPSRIMTHYWRTMLKLVKHGQVNSWAFIWSYAHFTHLGLAIIPSSNLISNVGFDHKATNTTFKSSLSALPHEDLHFPLSHPSVVKANPVLDRLIEQKYYNNPVAILGLLRQYLYYLWNTYVNRT